MTRSIVIKCYYERKRETRTESRRGKELFLRHAQQHTHASREKMEAYMAITWYHQRAKRHKRVGGRGENRKRESRDKKKA